MKKIGLFVFGLVALGFVGCGEKVADPEALFQKYVKDDAAREAKIKECSLLSVDDQLKNQTCAIANKAAGRKGAENAEKALKDFRKNVGKKE